MMSNLNIMNLGSYSAQERLEPQEKFLAKGEKGKKLTIGIPKEHKYGEKRVPLIPSDVHALTGLGHTIFVEKGAGDLVNYSDKQYADAGAELTFDKEKIFKSDLIVKVAPPTIEECKMLHADQILISPLYIPELKEEIINTLLSKRVIAIAMEYLMDKDGTFPLVRIMSELAGRASVLISANLLTNSEGGAGTLLGGISGVPPAKVLILGAGVVGEFACRTAIGLGAHIVVFDRNIYKLMRIQDRLGKRLFTSSLSPSKVSRELPDADVVIGAMHSKSGRSPIVISEAMVESMKNKSVVVDVSIDQGGCIETSRLTSQENPTFEKHGVIHYCVPNIASSYARTASMAFSNILAPILVNAGQFCAIERLFYENPGLRHGIYVYKGKVTNQYIARRYDIQYTNLNLVMTSEH